MTQHHTFTPALTAVGKTRETASSQALDELHLGSGISYPHYVDRQELTIQYLRSFYHHQTSAWFFGILSL